MMPVVDSCGRPKLRRDDPSSLILPPYADDVFDDIAACYRRTSSRTRANPDGEENLKKDARKIVVETPVDGGFDDTAEFERLTRDTWSRRWRENNGNWLLAFTGLVAIAGTLVMFFTNVHDLKSSTGPLVDATGLDGPTMDPSVLTDPVGSDDVIFAGVTPGVTPSGAGGAEVRRVAPGGSNDVAGGASNADGNGMSSDVATDPDLPNPSNAILLAVRGVKSAEGTVRVAVYDSADRFNETEKAFFRAQRPAEIKDPIIIPIFVRDLPPTMAVAVHHDLNDDGVLNRDLVGIPSEPYGFSRQARSIMGPPPFEAAKMPRPQPSATLNISIR